MTPADVTRRIATLEDLLGSMLDDPAASSLAGLSRASRDDAAELREYRRELLGVLRAIAGGLAAIDRRLAAIESSRPREE